LAGLELLSVLNSYDRARSEAIDARFLVALAAQRKAWVEQVLLRLGIVVGDHALRDAGRLVELLGHRPVLDQVLVLHHTGLLGDHRAERRIPFGDAVAAADDMPALAQQVRAVRNAMRGKLAPVHVEDRDLAR